MEIEITKMVEDSNTMPTLSGSAMELGDNAGAITWNNCLSYAKEHPILKIEQIQNAKNYFKSFGAWSKEEIEKWSELEVQALTIQFIAGNIRELEKFETFEDYLKASNDGQVSGDIFKHENKYYSYLDF